MGDNNLTDREIIERLTRLEIIIEQLQLSVTSLNQQLKASDTIRTNQDDKYKEEFVSAKRFNPIEKIVYGIIGLLISGIVTAGLNLILG